MELRFYSIKSFPERFGLWQMGALIGDLMQPALQYNVPFLLTMGVQVLDPNGDVVAFHDRDLVVNGVAWLRALIDARPDVRCCSVADLMESRS